ncbi:PLP-dependent aminotransferase family protein [Oricola sp.]|uniref:aminotransferase-like domain-containing protein n=1 Tax=Oricola sp. TaxID=1979950 RepID=UPI0025D3E7F6|nr:PLP-dependent aminotransferase family protein [Oricola sp.]MCI5074529.1 PLP-dependent aminotransferase family protein [Oricola sp.]
MDWYPTLPCGEGPRYVQIVAALRSDIANGRVAAGQRLPTHREMASQLGLSVGTISKAYALAERQQLISGQVGRGTFVRPPANNIGVVESAAGAEQVNLALNAPPPTGEAAIFSKILTEIAADDDLPSLLGYLPHQGIRRHRAAIRGWLARHGTAVEQSDIYITNGAQHAISVSLRLLARPGAPVLAENLPYSGLTALALMEDYMLHGVAMDEYGLVPDSLDAALRETGAKVLCCTPTIQTATGAIMPAERRSEVADIIRRHDAWIIEDDVYSFLCPDPPPTLSSFLPERSFYVMSFAKCLMPGLRIGALHAPAPFRDRIVNAIRSTGWMANAIMSEAVVRMIDSGALENQIRLKRNAAAERTKMAHSILGEYLLPTAVPAFHAWLTMPAGRTASSLAAQAAFQGVTLATPSPLSAASGVAPGIRICLGAASTPEKLSSALHTLDSILRESEEMAFV